MPLYASRCCGAVIAAGYGPDNIVGVDPKAETDADAMRVGFCPSCNHREPLLDRLDPDPSAFPMDIPTDEEAADD